MAEYLLKTREPVVGCDGCPCLGHNPITRDFFCNPTLVTLEEEYANNKPNWCPLVAIPPHGRLIDADALVCEVSEWANNARILKSFAKSQAYKDVLMLIGNEPAVLEANK